MGIQKQKWTAEEEAALRAGVDKHGTGKWKNILTDPQFAPALFNRSNIDLKDKWRNLSVSGNASGSRDRVRMPKLQRLTIGSPSSSQNPVSAPPVGPPSSSQNPVSALAIFPSSSQNPALPLAVCPPSSSQNSVSALAMGPFPSSQNPVSALAMGPPSNSQKPVPALVMGPPSSSPNPVQAVSVGPPSSSQNPVSAPAMDPPSSSQNPASAVPLLEYHCTPDPLESSQQKKKKYSELIIETLSAMKDSNGLESHAIVDFIEQRYEVSQNFRRCLASKLKRLVKQGKIEKVENCYRIKDAATEPAEVKVARLARPATEPAKVKVARLARPATGPAKLKVGGPAGRPCSLLDKAVMGSANPVPSETKADAASYAAYKIATAENEFYKTLDAFGEADRLMKLAEEAEIMLQLANYICEKCEGDGFVLLAD